MTEDQKKQLRWKKEIDLLEFYGMKVGINCFLFDFEVEYLNKLHSIHTFSGGDPDKEIMFLLHGYGGSNIHYCRIYEQLIKEFRVFSIDLPGMGYSSKQDIKMDTAEEALEFFMVTISKFIKELLPGQKVILVGHSFGGYIASHLLVRFPELFTQLFLLSPAGGTYYDDNEIRQLQDTSKYPFWQRMFFNFAKNKWNEQITPVTLKDKWYGNYFIKKYLKKRMALQGKEYELWQSYIDEMLALPNGSEKALFILLNFPRAIAKGWSSIEYILTQHHRKTKHIPIYFYFGEVDWMDQKGAHNLLNNPHIDNIEVRTIPKAGHQLNFENPKGVYDQLYHDSMLHRHQRVANDFEVPQEQQIILT